MPNAIIVGCATGMGKESARLLAQQGFNLGLADLQIDLLATFSKELPGGTVIRKIDVAHHGEAREQLAELIEALGGVDLFIYSAGIKDDKTGRWESENQVHQVNAIGFAALAHFIFNYYRSNNKKGHIVGLTSVLAMRGFRFAIPYCASKSFMRAYMQGLRHESAINKLGISITEIRPGFVDTGMIKNQRNVFWVSAVEKAATQILIAINRKKKWAYVSSRWGLIGLICKYLPEVIVNSSSGKPLLVKE